MPQRFLNMTLRRCIAAVVAGALASVCGGASAVVGSGAGHGGLRFVNLELPSTPPAPVGTRCPGSAACWNHAVEPAIRADPAGTFYVSTENGLFSGTIAAKSSDGGLHYESLASPNELSATEAVGFAPGGGDTDLATAPDPNAAGFHNVYVASLSLADVDVSTSADGGATWKLNPTGAQIEGDDREWIAADGATKVCISYHDLATFNVDVDCSYDAGATFTQHALPGAIDAAHAFLLQNNQHGNLVIDPATHVVYQVLAGIAGPTEVACGLAFMCKYHAVWLAVSTDGGRTFADYPVYVGPSSRIGYNHVFPNVAIDRAGTVYVLFSDGRDVYLTYSRDRGRTWIAPTRVNRPPAATAIFPWAVGGDAGKLDVVYYGTSYRDDASEPDAFPASAKWHAYFAQSLDVTGRHVRFTQVRVTPVVHTGAVCEGGISCSGNRDLFDDFGVAASPVTGMASIAYTEDQYSEDPEDQSPPGCTREKTNTYACDRTAIATQVGGFPIFGSRLR